MLTTRLLFLPTILTLASSLAGAQSTTFTLCGTVDFVDPSTPLSAPWDSVAVGDAFTLVYTFDCGAADSDPSTTFGYYGSAMTSFTFTAGTASTSQTIPPASADLRIFSGQPAGYDQYESFLNWDTFTLFFQFDDSTGTAFDGNVPRDGLPCCLDLDDFGLKDLTFAEGFGPFGGQFHGVISGCSTCAEPPVGPTCAGFDAPAFDGWSGSGVTAALATPGPSGAATDYYLESTDLSGPSFLESADYAGDWTSLAESGCAAVEYDVQIFQDSMPGQSPMLRPALVLYGPGSSPIRAAFRTTVESTEPAGIRPGWHHVTAPLAPLTFGVLPSGPDGRWEMLDGAPASDWDVLLDSVAKVTFSNDFSSASAEIVGYDNICLTAHGCVCTGKRPEYAMAAWPRSGSVAVTTTDADPASTNPDDQNPYVVHVTDLTTIGTATAGTNFGAAFYHHPNWHKSDLGTVFGAALDGQGNIYVAHSSVFGYPGAAFADALGFGGAGAIYKLDKALGAPALFAALPNLSDPAIVPVSESMPGIGDLAYDCKYDRLYASNFEDGKVYVYSMNGTLVGTYDHGVGDNGAPGFAPLGERVWAVAVYGGRLYYSLWNEDIARPNLTGKNEIWSVALDGSGFPVGLGVLEISMPEIDAFSNWSNPVAGIGFSDAGLMLVAERSMDSDTSSTAHVSWGREFQGPAWVETANSPLKISIADHSTAGGCDYERGSNSGERRWFTGDYLKTSGEVIYGLQGAPAINPSAPAQSVLIDLDENTNDYDKFQIGDVKISCAEGNPAEPGQKFCAGDGMPHQCPCGNLGGLGRGCANSANPAGAQLCATGDANSEYAGGFGADTVQFQVEGMPSTICLLLSSFVEQNPPPFLSDGILCCGGQIKRLAIHLVSPEGEATFGYPTAGEEVSVMSEAAPGTTACYQVWYRDTVGPCGQGSNLTNGYRIPWH